ncbi:hypothetical protein GGR57DRAFT_467467 [Xylariaceae sp. FL1272]|nr:hypothetical protein GGR57DRAFT_467467 [Xylariaceae sp. FL1272]
MNESDESFEPLMDFGFNVAELLAVDLEESTGIFESRQLTAGAPAPGLASDGMQRRYSLQHDCHLKPILSSELARPALSKSKSQSILQTNNRGTFGTGPGHELERKASLSSSDCSAYLKPPSLSTRAGSLVTIETSIESPTFLNTSLQLNKEPTQSWMDFSFDEMSPTVVRRRSSLSDIPFGFEASMMANRNHPVELHTPGGQEAPVFKFPPTLPPRRSSLQHQEAYALWSATRAAAEAEAERYSRPSTQPQEDPKDQKAISQDTRIPIERSSSMPSTSDATYQVRDDRNDYADYLAYLKASDEDTTDRHPQATLHIGFQATDEQSAMRGEVGHRAAEVHNHVSSGISGSEQENMELAGIFSGDVDIQAWLQSSTQNEFLQRRKGRIQPTTLSPSAIETLRVTVSCFPDTMLACDSLTIDNIRNALHTVRPSSQDGMLSASVTKQKGSKWKFPMSLFSKPQNQDGEEQERPMEAELGHYATMAGKEWDALKCIFSQGTDQLCNSLYAHILAFNYITAICPRAALQSPIVAIEKASVIPPVPSWKRHRVATVSTMGSGDLPNPRRRSEDTVGAPKKAASILGIGEPCDTRPATAARSRRNSITRPSTAVDARGSDGVDSLRDLRITLAKCVARLVATLRTSGSNDDRGSYAVEDAMFMQALCEVVRCAEMK